ncbi:unnamed protein product [Citrullus colocynthis]|uniref:Uncharacterized protein n=1 Tax=Citrullus colocynthis TaxID=252529 RepID=A0ABP0Z153_9ROSI
MVSISSCNVFSGACALMLLGLHIAIYQVDAKNVFIDDGGKNVFIDDGGFPIIDNVLSDPSIKHPKRHILFSQGKPKKVPDLDLRFTSGVLSKEDRTPLSGPSPRTSDNPHPPPHHVPSVILRKESGIDFEILPKGLRIPPSGPSTRTSNYPPPPPHAPFVILKKESKINFEMYPRNNTIPPSSPSGRVPL